MPAINPSSFNQYLEIQMPTITKDAEGGRSTAWAKFCNVHARKNNLSGGERSATSHGGKVAIGRTEYTTYYREDITEDMRILHNGKYYAIEHINNYMEGNKYLIITCSVGAHLG